MLVTVVEVVWITVVVCAGVVPKAKYAPPATMTATITIAAAATVVLTPFLRMFMFERRSLVWAISVWSKVSNYASVEYRENIDRVVVDLERIHIESTVRNLHPDSPKGLGVTKEML